MADITKWGTTSTQCEPTHMDQKILDMFHKVEEQKTLVNPHLEPDPCVKGKVVQIQDFKGYI